MSNRTTVKARTQRKALEYDLGFTWGVLNRILLGLGVAVLVAGYRGALQGIHHPGSGAAGPRVTAGSSRLSALPRAEAVNGRIAQLVEHLPYKQGVTGSSPVSPTSVGSRSQGGTRGSRTPKHASGGQSRP